LGSAISSDGDVETDINVRLGKAATIYWQLNRIWQTSSLSQNVKLKLYMSTVVATALYASETWKSTTRIQHRLDVFHQRNLWKIHMEKQDNE